MAGLKAWLFLTILCISRMQMYHSVKMLNSFCVCFCWFKSYQNNAAYILHVLYLYTFCICKICFVVQRREGNECTGLKRIQTSDCGSSIRSDRKPVRRKSVRQLWVVDIFCLFYQPIVVLFLWMTPDLLGDSASPLPVLMVWMVLTLPSEGWHAAQSQPIRASYLPGLSNGSRFKHLTQTFKSKIFAPAVIKEK